MPLVAGLSMSEQAIFAERVTRQVFPPGRRMVVAGEAPPGIFELLGGIAKVERQDGVTLALLAPGDTFGEMSLLNNFVASADVISVDECQTLCISAESLHDITENHATIAAKLYRSIANILSKRLRETSRRVPPPALPVGPESGDKNAGEPDWRAERDAALDGLERTGMATLAVDRDARILFRDRRAEALLAEADGIRALRGRLVTTDRLRAADLARLIRAASSPGTETPGSGLTLERSAGRAPLSLLVTPYRTDRHAPDRAGALVFVRDPSAISPAPAVLQDLFGLTPMEAEIGARLAEGVAPEQIAAILGVGLSTVRHHIKNLYSKMGTTRQGEFVALVLRSVAPLAGE